MEVKILGIDNKEEIIAFDKLCFPTDCWKEEDWHNLLSDSKTVYYAIIDQDKIIGDVFIYNWLGEKDYVKIMNIAIHHDYREKGLANMLLKRVQNDMVSLGMKKFCGETRESNIAMQKTFEKCGYKLNVKVENYYENPNETAYKYVLVR